jgi:hypothetical protein
MMPIVLRESGVKNIESDQHGLRFRGTVTNTQWSAASELPVAVVESLLNTGGENILVTLRDLGTLVDVRVQSQSRNLIGWFDLGRHTANLDRIGELNLRTRGMK